ncbi:peptidoglycan editing factor PgeF [Limnobacter sp.]|uniref:peptidoglycan editing factor PgeF n=1 Tax=Limnobacter sp. TaxID=2003368 RepID=UPI00258D868C|nr:peptidoglycan editing factor PgeF [Limnobacter sp.]HEX5485445.1 peptidoglycan editing factor PgeF [Limnobacter sp.]
MAAPICWPTLGPEFSGVLVGVTTRGQATGRGFNLATHVGDELSEVQGRRALLEGEVGAPLVWLNQVHGADTLQVSARADTHLCAPADADASVTRRTDIALAVMTADCLPVVMVARDSRNQAIAVGVAHAGWRGLHGGVLESCLNALMDVAQVKSEQCYAWMGPAIGPQSYEVGAEVRSAFVDQDPQAASAFHPSQRQGRWMADLYTLARQRLQRVGLATTVGGDFDTFTDPRWFSHRRAQVQSLPAGRIATFVRLLPVPVA